LYTSSGQQSNRRFAVSSCLAAEGKYKALFATAAGTGMRAGELFGLEVQDVDLNAGIIHVRRSVWEGSKQSPKTKNAYRKVGIDANLVKLLAGHIGDRKQGYLFPTSNGTPLCLGNVVERQLWPILDELKIPRSGMHSFRHGRVSFLVEHDVPIVTIKAWIGRGSEKMIERYTHSRPEFHQSVLAKLPCIAA
jgi:integrase